MPDILDKIEQLPPAPRTLTGDDVVLLVAEHAWFTERTEMTVDGLKTEVRDKTGKLRYTEIHPAYFDAATAQYVKAVPTVAEAAPEDPAEYKTVGAMDKYGFSQDGWIIGIKSRSTGTQYLTRPYALTRHDGKHTNDNITKGIYEYAQPATAFGQEEGRAAKWAGIFKDCEIRAEVSDGGALAVQHTWRKEAVDGSEWYGVIWEVDCKAEDYLALIQPDGPHETRLQPYVTDKGQYIVEYFPLSVFQTKDSEGTITGVSDVTHDYTTLNAGLSANLDLARGSTYYLTANVTLGTYNVTSSGSSGRVTVKTSGAVGFQVNSTGTFNVSYIDFTSKNDDTLGETISGSTGSPAIGDQTVSYVLCNGTGTTSITVSEITSRYTSVAASAGIFAISATATGRTFSITNLTLYYNTVTNGSGFFVGGGNNDSSSWAINGLVIGNTNTCSATATAIGCLIRTTSTFQNIHISLSSSYILGNGLYVLHRATSTATVTNVNTDSKFGLYAVYMRTWNTGVTGTSTVQRCTLSAGSQSGSYGVYSVVTTGDANNVTLKDCIIMNTTNGVGKSGTGASVTHTYNAYYNNSSADCFEALTASEQTGIDPQLGNLPTGATIAAGFAIPNGYAVGNLALEFDGSDTFDNLSIDETQYSATGYRYAGTKNITPGIQYQLSAFPESITVAAPNTGDSTGGTSVTLTVNAMGSSQGTGTVTFGGDAASSYTSWADTSIVAVTPAHAAGAVDIVVTNYRGAVVTLTGGFTYNASSTPTISSVSPSSGRIGTSVTITGTNFGATQGTGYCSLGKVISWSDTSIVVQAGSGRGLVDVTVVTN